MATERTAEGPRVRAQAAEVRTGEPATSAPDTGFHSPEKLQEMNVRFVSERVSPGGSADMLALTMLADALTTINLQH